MLSGVITDPSGAVIPGATIVLHPADGGTNRTLTSSAVGRFSVTLPAGDYMLYVTAPQFVTYASDVLALTAGKPVTLTVPLKIDVATQQVEVTGDEAGSETSRAGNTLVLKGSMVEQLPMDPTELSQELQGLAGGQSPEIYVNGFSGGAIPPRDTIREIRINQNPYSAENDVNPVNGRVEIFTKPGTNKVEGFLGGYGNDSPLNSRNPFVPQQPPYYSDAFFGNLSGPLTKKLSYFMSTDRNSDQQNAVVNAQALDASGNTVTVQQAVPAPNTSTNFSIRLDSALGSRNTFSGRYNLDRSTQTNGGVGLLVLASAGFDNLSTVQTLQLSNSAILTNHIVNDTRFQHVRSRIRQTPVNGAPSIVVEGVFTGGGSSGGSFNDNTDRYELQNYLMASEGKHYLTTGGRLRVNRDANSSTANYNGTYTFATLAAYAQAIQTGVGASQFSLAAGDPGVTVSMFDLGLFLQDDWKIRPNFTLSSGLRLETQDHISDHADFAPRLAFQWSLGIKKDKPARYILRGAGGLFYQRLGTGQILQAARQNGISQQDYVVSTPQFFFPNATPASLPGTLGAAAPSTIYQIDSTFHAPYGINSTLSLEKPIGNHGSITLSYRNVRGIHQLLTRNINAPLPGTYNPAIPSSGVRPLGGMQNIYQYAAEGISNSNRVSTNFFLHFRDNKLFTFGYLEGRDDKADTTGSFPTNQYNPGQDYGRSPDDTHTYFNLGGGGEVLPNTRVFGFIQARSGTPFDITLGQDINGDSIFNDRPTFATDLTRPSVVKTAYGNFDTSPIAGQTVIPFDYGTGPAFVTVNINVNHRFSFGPEVKPPPGAPAPKPAKVVPGKKVAKVEIQRKYELYVGVDSQNVLNHLNLATPVGTLNSPLFGHPISLANNGNGSANRVVNVQAFFHF
jgi:hypothetical protein